MKNLNLKQTKLNKLLFGLIIALLLIMGWQRLTEQKRVEYYICYERLDNATTLEHEQMVDYCKGGN